MLPKCHIDSARRSSSSASTKGCNVVFADLTLTSDAQKFVDAHEGKTDGPRAVVAPTDVTQWDQLAASFDVANAEFGGIDLVCPGAGVFEVRVLHTIPSCDTLTKMTSFVRRTLGIC